MGVKAECTWGEGPDVLVAVGRDAGWVHHTQVSSMQDVPEGTFELTAKAARRLAAELIVAAERAEELERGYEAAMRAPG